MIFIFHFCKADPFDLCVSEHYPLGKEWSKLVFRVFLFDLMAFLMHKNARP